jgi:hypothetical protein
MPALARYMKSDGHPWREAAIFEDAGTNSQAIVLRPKWNGKCACG